MAGTIQDGMTVQINYTLTVEGVVVDSGAGRGPLRYVHGQGQILRGLERQLIGLGVGETGDFIVEPSEGYGQVDLDAFIQVRRDELSPDLNPEVGTMVRGTGEDGKPVRARIHAVDGDSITLDLNHPLAGKTLQFSITVVAVSPER